MPTLATVRVVAALDARVEQIVKALTLNVVANLVRAPAQGGTPVDTGWARANWIPSIGSPRDALAGSRESVSTVEQEAGVALVAGTYKLAQGAGFVSNHVPYIGDLNAGASPQAEAGFVERAVVEAAKQVGGG